MKLNFLHSLASDKHSWHPGGGPHDGAYEVADKEAARLIKAGFAEPAGAVKATAAASAETAKAIRPKAERRTKPAGK